MRPRFVLATVMFVLPACGGGGGDDPGGGTGTLFVDADIEARPEVPNAQDAADFSTSFDVRVTRGGQDVVDGTVTISSDAGDVALVYAAADNRWHGDQNGYHRGYELTIASGTDEVDGVVLRGPDVHWFTEPVSGATVDAALPLEIRWDRDDAATVADLETEETDRITIEDTGAYTLPAFSVRSNDAQVESDRLELRRWSRITPAGAVAGSELRVEIENRIDVVVAACPTCP